MTMNTDQTPPGHPPGSIDELLATLSTRDNWPQQLADLKSQQEKVVALIKELEGKEQAFKDLTAQQDEKSAVVSATIASDMAAVETAKVAVADRENSLQAKIEAHEADVQVREDGFKERAGNLAAKEAELGLREAAIVEKEKLTQDALNSATALRDDVARRLALIQKAQE